MLEKVKDLWEHKPLAVILVGAFAVRLIAVLFSKGYGMHDDHFLVIEAAQSWVDGNDYNRWLPENRTNKTPTGHSWFYVGLHYYFLKFLEWIGIYGAQTKMYFVRFIHALWYLVGVYFTFKITERLDRTSTAKSAALLVSFLWFMPILSVRNLVEVVCIPFVLGATYFLVKSQKLSYKHVIFAGILMGLSVAVRFQTVLFLGGMGIVLLSKNIVKAALLGIVFTASLFITQIGDLFLWGKPFAEFGEYIAYNFANKTSYFSRPWYMYFGTISGLVLPPLSIFLWIGWSKVFRKKYLLLLLPSLVFFIFHSYFPNKQERFILPFVPFFIILGLIGWNKILQGATERIKKINHYGMTFFWGLNAILLLAVTPAFTKKSRVELMEYLGTQKNYHSVFVEQSTEHGVPLLPRYYAQDWSKQYDLKKMDKLDERIQLWTSLGPDIVPHHIVFFEPDKLDERIQLFRDNCNCELKKLVEIEPSYVDKFVHWLNPVNDNEKAFVYEIKYLDK